MQFRIIDLVWATMFAGLILTRFHDRDDYRQLHVNAVGTGLRFDIERRETLRDVEGRLRGLEGWGNSIDKRLDDDGRRGVQIDATLAELITDKIKREQADQTAKKHSP